MNTQGKHVTTHRILTGALAVLAVSGWGAFAYASLTASPERAPQSQAARSETDRNETTASQKPGETLAATPTPTGAAAEPPAASVTGSVQTAALETPVGQSAGPVASDAPASPRVVEASAQQPAPEPAASAAPDNRININTASVEELNRLGHFGTAIVARRPYKKVEELLSKRVLKRSAFNRIKDQITAN